MKDNHIEPPDICTVKWTSGKVCAYPERLFKKADDDGRDPYLTLLEYRNTPVSGLQYTQSQMLMSRLLRSKLPTKHIFL